MSSPSIRHGRPGFIATFALTLLAATLVPLAQSQQPAATTAPPFPLATGTTFVIAVSNELGSTSASNPTVAQGDYDVVVTPSGSCAANASALARSKKYPGTIALTPSTAAFSGSTPRLAAVCQ